MGLRIENDDLFILDQTLLPHEEKWIEVKDCNHMVSIIKNLQVRGAPLIGVSALCFLAIAAENGATQKELLTYSKLLRESRPTAVNLMILLDRVNALLNQENISLDKIIKEAEICFEEDVMLCEKLAQNGEALISDGDSILTHCNTGGLATVGCGTALGVIKKAFENGKKIHVYVDETRPLLQGGRLTTWELQKTGIPFTLITDSMAAFLMAQKKIHKVFLGSDRIALNGDFANKIGTYSAAVCAHYHGIPFYPVAPYTTIDPEIQCGSEIPVEQRHPFEVQGVKTAHGKLLFSQENVETYNPSFDVTPVQLVTALVLDKKVYTQNELIDGALKRDFSNT